MSDPPETGVLEILGRVKQLAKDYYALTGKPLGVTGEMAEYEAHRLLGVELAPPRTPGYDAIEVRDGRTVRLQIKGRCLQPDRDKSPRLGSINTAHSWDGLLMVLLDEKLDAVSIHEAPRASIQDALDLPGSSARNVRQSLSVSKVKQLSTLRWKRTD
jgi:hypothetical protein